MKCVCMNLVRALTVAALAILSVAFPRPSIAEGNQIVVGALLCLSGDCAEYGTNSRRGVELAIQEVNDTGGVLGKKLVGVFEDSRDCMPSVTVSSYQRLIARKDLRFIIGPSWTLGGMSIAPLISANKNILVVSPSVGVKEFNETANNIFNVWAHDEKGSRALAQYAYRQGFRSAAIFGSQDPWTTSQSEFFEQEFLALGGTIATRVDPLPGTRELRSEALKIKSKLPDVVFISNTQTDVIAKEFAAIQYNIPKLSILMERDRVVAANGALEGSVFAQYELPTPEFTKSFENKFEVKPGIAADTAYDAVMVTVKAIRDANSTNVADVRESLHAIRNFHGASGTFSFDSKGAVDKSPVLWKIQGTEEVRVEQTTSK